MEIRNKDGHLSAYGLACGYIQTAANGWQLFHDGCYHVRRSAEEWLTFSSLTKARKTFKQLAMNKKVGTND
jgi:hypothetical protein